MLTVRDFAVLFVVAAAAVYICALEHHNTTQHPFTGHENMTGNETEIIPCEEMNCTEGTCCQLGREICSPMQHCFNRSTQCRPFSGNETSNSTMSGMGNNTVVCPTHEEGSGYGEKDLATALRICTAPDVDHPALKTAKAGPRVMELHALMWRDVSAIMDMSSSKATIQLPDVY
ncbi:hypothetical protein OESDEN_16390 [Oesophagostomum dentatum]|uniref:Uncharacterized protein n=1 Tax=Oesophagostomum dentatum TaxID=61180 RepID=A0A0B1SF02_OESDE|nr:hypothetical protein OESDEN_16390 [Oesophagostomum dentatum]